MYEIIRDIDPEKKLKDADYMKFGKFYDLLEDKACWKSVIDVLSEDNIQKCALKIYTDEILELAVYKDFCRSVMMLQNTWKEG